MRWMNSLVMGLEDEAVVILDEGDFAAFADGVFLAKPCGDDQLSFACDGQIVRSS
jgi:hypothetical protein